MTTTPVNALTNIGTITTGDKLVGERVDGTTVRIVYGVDVTLDTAPVLGGNLGMGSYDTIYDSNGNELFKLTKVASAVNYITLINSATGNGVELNAAGDDSNIDFILRAKASGVIKGYSTSSSPLTLLSGTSSQHSTTFTMANTAASRTVTVPDADGTMALNNVLYGGTGVTSFTAYAPIVGGTTTTGGLQSSTNGSSGQLYQSAGSSAVPGWTTATYPTTASTSGKLVQSNGTNLVMSTPTYPSAASTSGKLVQSDGTNLIMSTPTYPTTSSTSGKLVQSDGTNLVMSTPTYPAAASTSGKLIQSDGTNLIMSTPTWPTSASTLNKRVKSDGTNLVMSSTTIPDSGTVGKLIRGDGTNYVETTATFADTYTTSNLLYSNGSNTVTGLATANSGVLVTSSGGVPSISTDIPTAVTIGGAYNYRAGGTDVVVADGGTGLSSTTAYAVLCGGTTTTASLQSIAALGSSGDVLTSNGAGALPTFQAVPAGTEVTQAEQEAGTNTTHYVSAAKQQYHPSASKCWGTINGAGTSILASYNVASITDLGTGQLRVTLTTSFSSTNWACSMGIYDTATIKVVQIAAQTASLVQLNSNIVGTGAADPNVAYFFAGYGDQ